MKQYLTKAAINKTEIEFLVDGFSNGFCIPYFGPRVFRKIDNHHSFKANLGIGRAKIDSELEKGRVSGPFDQPPFKNLVCSPLGLVPKQNGSYPLIHDLSFPKGKGISINEGIGRDDSVVAYDSIDTVIELVKKFGRGALLCKSDIEDAFRLLPIHPQDRLTESCWDLQFQSMAWINILWMDVCLWVCLRLARFLSALVQPYKLSWRNYLVLSYLI